MLPHPSCKSHVLTIFPGTLSITCHYHPHLTATETEAQRYQITSPISNPVGMVSPDPFRLKPVVATALLKVRVLAFRRKSCLAYPQPHSQPGRSPTHLLELRVDELQPVGVNLVQVIAAAPWPIRLGALAKFRVARGHLGGGAFQRREDPRKSRGGVMRGKDPQPATFTRSGGLQ